MGEALPVALGVAGAALLAGAQAARVDAPRWGVALGVAAEPAPPVAALLAVRVAALLAVR